MLLREGVSEPSAVEQAKFAYGFVQTAGGGLGLLAFGPLCVRFGRRRAFFLIQLAALCIVPIKGTWNVLDAARRAGVHRIVHTSSLMVVWGYPPPEWVPADTAALPVGTYAQTKHLAEILCEHAARSSNPSIVCLRIAKPIDLENPAWKQRPLRPQWVPFPDLIEAYRLALTADISGCEIVTVVGESSRRRWDLSRAERLLGFRTQYRLEEMGYTLGDENVPSDTA